MTAAIAAMSTSSTNFIGNRKLCVDDADERRN